MSLPAKPVALVTGVEGGVGRAVARALASAGAELVDAPSARLDVLVHARPGAGVDEVRDRTAGALPALRAARGQLVVVHFPVAPAPGDLGRAAAAAQGLRALADAVRDAVNADGVRVLSVLLARSAAGDVRAEDAASVLMDVLALPRTAEVTELELAPVPQPEPDSDSGVPR